MTVNRLADELLDQARASKFGFTDPSGVPVPAMYRCDALDGLPQGLQSEIVHKATKASASSPAFIMAILAFMAAMLLACKAAPSVLGAALPLPLMLGAASLAPMLQLVLVRRVVRRIARRVAASWPVRGYP